MYIRYHWRGNEEQNSGRGDGAQPMGEVNGHASRSFQHTKFVINAQTAPHNKAFGKVGLFGPPLGHTGWQVRAGERRIVRTDPAT